MSAAARAASIHARLLNGARERREEFNLTLGRELTNRRRGRVFSYQRYVEVLGSELEPAR